MIGVEMVFDLMQYWEVAVDGIQIFLCILILFFLIRNRRKKWQPDSLEVKSESGRSFNLQVFSQTINQQIELAFSNILESVAVERRNLDNVLQSNQFDKAASIPAVIQRPLEPSKTDAALLRSKETASMGDHLARIQKLAARGMSAKQIADELKTPRGEVELILRLQPEEEN
jgi:hypothetical protein